jgi:hypothetical protein
MSTAENGGAGTVVSESTITIDPSTNQPVPAPNKSKAGDDDSISMPKSAFNARLERERTAWMKDLGVDSLEAVKQAIETAKAAAEAQKTDAEKAASAKSALEAAQAKNAELFSTMAEVAKATLEGLTEEQRNAVLDLAGDDPAKQIKAANTVKKLVPAAIVTPTTPAAPAVQNTLPAQGAPREQGNTGSAPDPQAIFVEMMKVNPYAATQYAERQGLIKRA